MNRLLPEIGRTDPTCLEDLILCMAKTIEAAAVLCGLEGGKDYTKRDLIAWALPFALHVFRSSKGDKSITFAVEFEGMKGRYDLY